MAERNPQKQAPASIAVSVLLMVYSYVPQKVQLDLPNDQPVVIGDFLDEAPPQVRAPQSPKPIAPPGLIDRSFRPEIVRSQEEAIESQRLTVNIKASAPRALRCQLNLTPSTKRMLDELVEYVQRYSPQGDTRTRERRAHAIHPVYQKPELLANAPNQLWSWDITKLRGAEKYSYFQLYVMTDVFSRYVTGWMAAERESAELAKYFIEDTLQKHEIPPDQLTIHADRGKVMRSKPVAFLMADLGVAKTHSRPYVSNDNPYSESQFRTLKYRPGFPDRFGCIQDCRTFCQQFFTWYNDHHCHSGISLLTPAMVHFGQAPTVLGQRQLVLDAAYLAHPERFVREPPTVAPLPEKVWINKPDSSDSTERKTHQILSPTVSKLLTRAVRVAFDDSPLAASATGV